MKLRTLGILVLLIALSLATGCSKRTEVVRRDVGDAIDLSGEWNDVDSQMVAEVLVAKITASPWVEDFRAENGKKPYVIVGDIRNRTSEHIPVATFTSELEKYFINSGRVRVVASVDEREQIRNERASQQEFASPETMKQWGREKGADYMLLGEVNAIFDSADGESVKYYQVDCYLVDLEDNVKVWMGDHKIKKTVSRGKFKG
ncbi:penicillin-binding protein activator LpoB [bacterium DOLZORAL124_64_63]|nr:MAG: penicillin-binding protein activator LpoB [bacterium DOLZORAL124_64_63]